MTLAVAALLPSAVHGVGVEVAVGAWARVLERSLGIEEHGRCRFTYQGSGSENPCRSTRPCSPCPHSQTCPSGPRSKHCSHRFQRSRNSPQRNPWCSLHLRKHLQHERAWQQCIRQTGTRANALCNSEWTSTHERTTRVTLSGHRDVTATGLSRRDVGVH